MFYNHFANECKSYMPVCTCIVLHVIASNIYIDTYKAALMRRKHRETCMYADGINIYIYIHTYIYTYTYIYIYMYMYMCIYV